MPTSITTARRGASSLALAGVLVMASVLSACSSSGSSGGGGGGGGSVNVLAITDTTGPTKAFGTQQIAGIEAAAKYINAKGGADGHKIVVTARSDNGDVSTATSVLVKELSSNPGKYTMVYPGSEGSEITAMMPVVTKYPVVGIAEDDGNSVCLHVSKCPNVFSALGAPALAQQKAGEWMRQKGYKKAGVIDQQIDFTEAETGPMLAELKSSNIAATQVSFQSDAVDLTSQMSRLKSAGVQVVYAEALGAAAGYVLKARAALNWNVPVLFDIAGSALDLTTLAPRADLANSYQTLCPCAVSSVDTPGIATIKSHSPAGTLSGFPANLLGDGWDTIILLANAIEQAKSTDHKKLIAALEKLSPAAQNDTMYVTTRHKRYTSSNHENVASTTDDYIVTPAGPIKGGQVQGAA